MFIIVLQRLALQFVLDIILFPVWWYTGGLRRVLVGLWHSLQDTNISLAPGLWLKNIFTPMFGQNDIEGRLMSVFMRIMNIIVRSIMLYIWMMILVVGLLLWLAIPLVLIYLIGRVLVLR
jgi:hypothetical protein